MSPFFKGEFKGSSLFKDKLLNCKTELKRSKEIRITKELPQGESWYIIGVNLGADLHAGTKD
jgi:hypothetical protein